MKTLVAIPCMDMVHTDFLRSCLSMERVGEVCFAFAQGSLVYDGRNALVNMAIEEVYDRVLWLDSDMRFDQFLLRRLSEHLDLGKEMVCGLYFTRKAPVRPVIYSGLYLRQTDGPAQPVAETFYDYPRDEVFKVAGCGFGSVLMTTELLRHVRDAYGLPFWPISGFGEDFSFCMRVTELGHEIWCDSSIKVGHVGLAVYDEELWDRLRADQKEDT